MRILLADLMSKHGYVVKDTVVGGYGSRLSPFLEPPDSIVTSNAIFIRYPERSNGDHRRNLGRSRPQVVTISPNKLMEADVAIVLSSLVDYRHEQAVHEARQGIVLGSSAWPLLSFHNSSWIIQTS